MERTFTEVSKILTRYRSENIFVTD